MILIIIFLTMFPNYTIAEISNESLSWYDVRLSVKRENQFFYKGQSQGCSFKENTNQSIICYGNDCKNYPSDYEIKKRFLKIKMTNIQIIKTNDFVKLGHITMLVIDYNQILSKLEPGCFKPMKNLECLKITLNQNLNVLDAKVFDGLENLKELSLKKNGFKHLPDITQGLSPTMLPQLKKLTLSENLFKIILKDDFITMKNTKIEELEMTLCGIEYINEYSLIVFQNLKILDLGQNHFNIKTITQVILQFIEYKIPLDTLSLYDLGYRKEPPVKLLETISKSNITTLSLAQNQFEQLNVKDFPYMPKIKSLDLSDNLIISIEPNTFDAFPSLEALYLARNKFSKMLPAILLPQLKILDLTMISGKSEAISYFNIENNIFHNMTKLTTLRLSYNLIESTNKYTFTGLDNLRYLELKNATLFNVEPNSFENNKKLEYLNLENNPLQAITLTYDSFCGLSELKTLLLGGCNINNLSVVPSPFYNLSSLTHLGLSNNMLYTLTSNIFTPLISLESLDLSNNKLIPWNETLFQNLSLKYVDVSQNRFTFLTNAMLFDFQYVENLNLEGNPFICDCNLLPLTSTIDLLTNRNNSYVLDIKCSNLKWQQKTIYDFILHLKNNPHECEIQRQTNKVLIITSSTVFLLVLIIVSILIYVYRDYVRYWLFLIKMAAQRHSKWWKKERINQSTFKYDAFVSYSCLDCYFVNKLVSQLEDNEPHLKLCVYERDFKIGSVISEEILQSVLKSRRTLLIISDGFAKSQWCRWETKLAEYHQIFFQNDNEKSLDDTLVMIKLNDVQKKYITPTLKYLMKTRIYLQWNTENENEFWEKLRSTLSTPKCAKRKINNETTL